MSNMTDRAIDQRTAATLSEANYALENAYRVMSECRALIADEPRLAAFVASVEFRAAFAQVGDARIEVQALEPWSTANREI